MSKNLEIWRGEPHPLGATLTDEGVNFALYAENAIAVELCLFDSPEPTATELRIPVTDQTDQTWHVLLPETGAGQLYGYRVHGVYEPARGLRFNPSQLVLDPYAQALAGQVTTGPTMNSSPRRCTRRSFMRCTSRGSPCSIRQCRFRCAAPTPA
jgi:isoamylase